MTKYYKTFYWWETQKISNIYREIFLRKRNILLVSIQFYFRIYFLYEDFFYKNIFIFLNSLSNTNFNSNHCKSSKSFQCLLYQFRVLSNSMELFFWDLNRFRRKDFRKKKKSFQKSNKFHFLLHFNFQQLIFTFYI